MSERASSVSAANGGVDDSEKRPLADAAIQALRFLAIYRGGRLRRDKLIGVTDETLEQLVGEGLIVADAPRPMLVDLPKGGHGIGDVVVYEITKSGRAAIRRSNV